jgi:peptide deformylase
MVLEIVKYGDPVLRAKGKRIEEVTEETRRFAADLTETMYAAHGLGLAAQQVGVAQQITVVDVAAVQEERPSTMTVDGQPVDLSDWMPLVLLNPQVQLGAEKAVASEGCLSFPEIHGDVPRAATITVQATLLDGRELKFEATGMLARAIQHEVDHLHGVLYIDRMNSATKVGLAGRLKRLQKEGAANPSHGRPRPAKRSASAARTAPASEVAEMEG